jgi:hypothetical protein
MAIPLLAVRIVVAVGAGAEVLVRSSLAGGGVLWATVGPRTTGVTIDAALLLAGRSEVVAMT